MKENLWESETKEEYPEPRHHKNIYVPIDEAHEPSDNSWERYGESSDTYTDDYAGELEDDRVDLQNIENKKSAFYFGGHYLDMDDPYDRAFYNAKKAELEESEKQSGIEFNNILGSDLISSGEIQSTSEKQSLSADRIEEPHHVIRRFRKGDKDKSGSRDNLKTLKNLKPEKIERINRGPLAKLKQDLVLGDTKDKSKYIDKETLYQDEISDILDAHQEQFADTLDNFEEINSDFKPW